MPKKKQNKYRFEFLYDRISNITIMIVWDGMQIERRTEIAGELTVDQKEEEMHNFFRFKEE